MSLVSTNTTFALPGTPANPIKHVDQVSAGTGPGGDHGVLVMGYGQFGTFRPLILFQDPVGTASAEGPAILVGYADGSGAMVIPYVDSFSMRFMVDSVRRSSLNGELTSPAPSINFNAAGQQSSAFIWPDAFAATTSPIAWQDCALQVVQDGVVTSWDIKLEGSLDGSNFDTLITHTQADGSGKIKFASGPVRFLRLRCNAIVLGAGTQVKCTFMGRP